MIIPQVIHPDDESTLDKQGISNRFLSYFQSLDKAAGHHALGPDQTISRKVQGTLDAASQRAKTVDEQGGYSRAAQDVSTLLSCRRTIASHVDIDQVLRESHSVPVRSEGSQFLYQHLQASRGHP